MPPDSPKPGSNDPVETAITQVLKAEVEARDAVAHARGEAEAIAEQARDTARRLGLRADSRIHAVRTAFDARATAEIAALEAQAAALNAMHDLTPAEISTAERAVAALAGALTEGSL